MAINLILSCPAPPETATCIFQNNLPDQARQFATFQTALKYGNRNKLNGDSVSAGLH